MSGTLSNPKSSWFDDDDVDDDLFLKNSRKPDTQFISPESNKVAQLQAQKKFIEIRTLESTERSLKLLHESEQVGQATAQELAEQREKLERSSKNLDAINATLRSTQRNIDGMRSIFTTFKNYLSGTKEPIKTVPTVNRDNVPEPTPSASMENHQNQSMAIRRTYETEQKPANAQQAIDRNLSYMSDNISNLKHLALNLGDEILDQNELLENMQYKAAKAEGTITKQNKDINRLLNKK